MENKFIKKETKLNMPIADVWQLWSTEQGLNKIFGSKCNFKLEIGGPIEILFDESAEPGLQGSEGCQIMAIEPESMLSFSWNAPPHLPEIRKQRTFVTLAFKSDSDKVTSFSLSHYGWSQGQKWDETYEYFSKAWGFVLGSLENICNT